MNRNHIVFLAILASGLRAGLAADQERVVESIVPALAYGPKCTSVVALRNLSDRAVTVDVEGHKASGALVSIVGHPQMAVKLSPGEPGLFKLDIAEETTGAWVKVRERVPSARLSPAVAVSANTECIVADQLRTVSRDVAFATRNPSFSSEVAGLQGGMISFINTTERVARATACYSQGGLYSVPSANRRGAELQPICTTSFEVQIPPFGSREFPVEREGTSYFTLKTLGDSIVLEMLRPVAANVRVYTVDTTIHFEGEVDGKPAAKQ